MFLRWLYGTISYIPEVPTQNAIGIVGYKDQLPRLPDLTSFMSALRSDAKSGSYFIDLIDAVPRSKDSLALEANLETQYAQAMAFPTKLIYYATSHDRLKWDPRTLFLDSGDAFLIWIDYLFSRDSFPQTIITLAGVLEEDVPPQYAWSVCALLANLGARGVSIISSSGDDGVGPTNCTNRFGNVQFMPRFPATCMCDALSSLSCGTKAQAQVAYHIATVSQVPISPASAARRVHSPRSRHSSPGAAFRDISPALAIRMFLCPSSSIVSAATIGACTSSFRA